MTGYDNLNDIGSRNTIKPIYPSVNPDSYQNTSYRPQMSGPSDEPVSNGGLQGTDKKSPTISQIMREWDIK